MTLLEEIYVDVVVALATAGAEEDTSICANELRAIRNRLEPMISQTIREEAARRAELFVFR